MAIDVDHRLIAPVALEDVVALFRGAITLLDPLLVHAGNRVFGTERGREVLEDPGGGAGEVGHLLLFLEVPVKQVDHVALGPVSILGGAGGASLGLVSASDFSCSLSGGDIAKELLGFLGVTSCIAVPSVLSVEEVGNLLDPLVEGLGVLGVASAVPAGPDAGRVDIDDVLAEITAPDRGFPRGIELMGKVVLRGHEGTDSSLVIDGEVSLPVVFVTKSPKDDGRMVVVLVDHVAEHIAALLLVAFSADATTAPRFLFPSKDAEFIAEI